MPGRRTESAETAKAWIPDHPTLASVREAASHCRACPLWKRGTQTVFGQGLKKSRVVLVGEQPGDEEDKQGLPFVGPAGRVLDKGLAAAGIERKDAYVTNAVKHFKWVAKGKRRLHQKPNAKEIGACLPWLKVELDLIRPKVVVALGATAAQALFGSKVRVLRDRGQYVDTDWAPHAFVTVHPSSILRTPDEHRAASMEAFVDDLTAVAAALRE